jgi:hypothetical protein
MMLELVEYSLKIFAKSMILHRFYGST